MGVRELRGGELRGEFAPNCGPTCAAHKKLNGRNAQATGKSSEVDRIATRPVSGPNVLKIERPRIISAICAAAYFSFGKAPGKYCEPRKAGAKIPGRLART